MSHRRLQRQISKLISTILPFSEDEIEKVEWAAKIKEQEDCKREIISALWNRRIREADEYLAYLDVLAGKRYYPKDQDVKWRRKAHKLVTWLLLPDNKELKRFSQPLQRGSSAYLEWRIAVLNRDGWKCVECGERTGLHVHHIKHYKRYIGLRLKVDNGVVLCKKHHWRRHKKRAS